MKKLIIIGSMMLCLMNTQIFAQENPSVEQDNVKPEDVIKKLDENKDGKIAKSEAKGPLKKSFDKADKNKDGFITLNELKKAPKKHKK